MKRITFIFIMISALIISGTPRPAPAVDLEYSTYLGGGDNCVGYAIAVDSSGAVYVTGYTGFIPGAGDFPVVNAYQSAPVIVSETYPEEVFVSKFAPGGSSLIYSTYLGGSGQERAFGIAVDPSGAAYVTGETNSGDFPTVNAYQSGFAGKGAGWYGDIFVSKLSSSGSSLLYSTYLGGSSDETGRGISVEGGAAYVTGETDSGDFPAVNAYQPDFAGDKDAFVCKLAPGGSTLHYSTFLGGEGDDGGRGISVEGGAAYVTGYTWSGTFPLVNAYQLTNTGYAAFVSKLSFSGSSLSYSTFLGEGCAGHGIAVEDGAAYITGRTFISIPVVNPYQSQPGDEGVDDAFVSKLSTSGSSLSYSTYLGGSDEDYGFGISVEDGRAYVIGQTGSDDFPVVRPYQSSREGGWDVFVNKLSISGASLFYSTYLGGSDGELAGGIAVEGGKAYVVGYTTSPDYPIVNPYQSSYGNAGNACVSRLSIQGEQLVVGSGDYNGDGVSDIAIFRGRAGLWAVRGVTRAYFGGSADTPVSGDYNGDGTVEIGIFRGSAGLWAVEGVTRAYFGGPSDTAIPGDYDGDGSCNIGIFRPSSGLWAVEGVTRTYFGGSSDTAVPGDYDGNGTDTIAIFRAASGLWALEGVSRIYFGGSSDTAVPGDYDGNGTREAGIFRPSAGLWAVRGVTRGYFGGTSDQPVPGDYDGDTRDDIGIFRDSAGLWAIRDVSRVYFGSTGDTPVTR